MIRLIFLAFVSFFSLLSAHTPPLLSLGGGFFNIFRPQLSGQYQIEYKTDLRWGKLFLPVVGLMVTTRGSTYLFGGMAADLVVRKRFSFIPSFCAGWYTKGGGKDLNYPLEFRSALEVSYIFDNSSRLGLQISHISNAGLSHHNPGAESLVLVYSIPLNRR